MGAWYVAKKNKQLKQEKERLYQEAIRQHEAVIKALKEGKEDL